MRKKKTAQPPKPRHVWTINPKTRITPSKKRDAFRRREKPSKDWASELFDAL